jgi:PIN domain nuclease of toxin-antitoxin system
MDAVDALLERLEVPFDIADALERSYFIELPIDVAHAVAAGELPRHHEDRFDRILVAQACTQG